MIMCIMYITLHHFFPIRDPQMRKKHKKTPGLRRGKSIIGGRGRNKTQEYNDRSHLSSIHPCIHAASHPSIHMRKSYTITRASSSSIIAGMMKEGKVSPCSSPKRGRVKNGERFEGWGHHWCWWFLEPKKNTVQFRNKKHTDFAS